MNSSPSIWLARLIVAVLSTQGELSVEWFDAANDKAIARGKIAGRERREFEAPFEGAAVLTSGAGIPPPTRFALAYRTNRYHNTERNIARPTASIPKIRR